MALFSLVKLKIFNIFLFLKIFYFGYSLIARQQKISNFGAHNKAMK